jgi:hypothetical protein
VTPDDIIDILSIAAAVDRRTVGESDVILWHELIGDLPKDLAQQAVIGHLREQPGVWLEPGHVVAGVRVIRREQAYRETDARRLAHETRCNSKAAPDDEYPVHWSAEQRVTAYWASLDTRMGRQPVTAAATAIPLCRACGARALLAAHEATRGVCELCWPHTNSHQPDDTTQTA